MDRENYKKLLTEIIQKQSTILGPEIAVMKAKSVSGISVSSDGRVTDISADPNQAVHQLIDAYVSLSGEIIKQTMSSLLSKYPGLSKSLSGSKV